MPKPVKQSYRFWGLCFIAWFILLNYLSHGNKLPDGINLNIPHLDKVVHFGYFFGGGGLLSATLFFKKAPSWAKLTLIVTISLSLVGIWDEFHQSFFENRTGNDPFDWLADTIGAFYGALVFKALHRRLL